MVVQEFQSLQMESCLELKGEKDFLQACSSADADTNFINYLSGANCQSAAYVSSRLNFIGQYIRTYRGYSYGCGVETMFGLYVW